MSSPSGHHPRRFVHRPWIQGLVAALRRGALVVLGGVLAGVLLSAAAPAGASLLHLAGPAPADLALSQGHLSPCPTPAHCAREDWPVQDPVAALDRLLPALLALDGVDLVESRPGYLHATATSRLFGFVDDLELHADPAAAVIEARSASRLGDSDLGVNARRLARLKAALATDQPSPPS
ncbi:MAG: DUF1499 domain-containing protein, partial [Cyanobium sp.]